MTDVTAAVTGVRVLTDAPQPLGVFGVPAGLLLVPTGPDTDKAREALLAGRLPEVWPESLEVHRLVHEGREQAALAELVSGAARLDQDLAQGEAAGDPTAVYNRWLLDPGSAEPEVVRAGLPLGLRPLVDVVAYTVGLAEAPRSVDLDPATAPECRALVLAAEATARLEAAGAQHGARPPGLDGEAPQAAADLLVAGAETAQSVSAVLAAVLRGNAGSLLADAGESDRAAALLTEAVAELAGADLPEVRAELLYRLGALAQEEAADGTGDTRVMLHHAMSFYYDALRLVSETSAPQLWASVQLNLAAAHLSSPMTQASDQLRMGVATQALRACRRVFTPAQAPQQWSTATLNLANALVYTPSTHQADNLVEAVELYEEVLESGVRNDDPLGRARLLANQGNALAHLGAFDPARAKLVEARFLFEEHLDHDAAMTVRQVLDEIAKAEVRDPDDDLTDLARQAEQLSRMPAADGPRTAGMGVRVEPKDAAARKGRVSGEVTAPPPKPRVTVVSPDSRPTES